MADAATPTTPICNAAFTSLHLDPLGNVRVCELNSLGLLGNIADRSLRELWDGASAQRVRAALRRHDLTMGCEGCAASLHAGDRAGAHAAYYDNFPSAGVADAWPRQLELSLSNACNLQCAMCNGDLSSAIRAHREGLPPLPRVYDDAFFDELGEFLRHVERVAFIGGEPFIGRESLRVLDQLLELDRGVAVNLTSNGTVLTDRVAAYVRDLAIELCISVDAATAPTYDAIRVGSDFEQVMRNIDRFAELTPSLSLSFCLMTSNWHEFGPFLRLAEERGLPAFVNVVVAPRRFSLYHLVPDELAAVLAHLEADDEQHPGSLVVNRRVQEQQVQRLRHHLDALRTPAPDAAPTPSAVALPSLPAATIAARAADARGTVRIDIGHSEQVLAIAPDPADALGMDLRPLLGGHLTAMVQLLTSTFGDLAGTDLTYHANGIEDRTMTFERAGSRTVVRAVLGGPHGDSPDVAATWHLGARSETLEPATGAE